MGVSADQSLSNLLQVFIRLLKLVNLVSHILDNLSVLRDGLLVRRNSFIQPSHSGVRRDNLAGS